MTPTRPRGFGKSLERAGKNSPDDDRVWLGQAHLATLLGRFEDALAWLDRCLNARADDIVVWRTRLEWAIAANRPREAAATLAHLPANLEPETRTAELRAWFAARQGNTQVERAALQAALALNPRSPLVLERLAQLELETGQRERAAEFRRRAELEQIRKSYEHLLFSTNPRQHAAELAQLAANLGRRFDSRHWATLGSVAIPPAARDRREAATDPRSTTLADVLAEIAGPTNLTAGEPGGPGGSAPRFQRRCRRCGTSIRPRERWRHRPPDPSGHVQRRSRPDRLSTMTAGWTSSSFREGHSHPILVRPAPGDRLFRNQRDGTFEDVTDRSGIAGMPVGTAMESR